MTQSISSFEETAKELDIKKHILHLWVKKFPLLQPKKDASGELGFAPRDISFARGLKVLLIDEAKTIQEAQKILNERGVSYIAAYGREKSTLTYKKSLNMGAELQSTGGRRSASSSIADQLKKIFPGGETSEEKHIISAEGAGLIDAPKKTDAVEKNKGDNMAETITENSLNDAGTSHFEDKWRDFMHDKGKIASKDEIIAKRYTSTEYDDIAFIDEDDNIDDYIKNTAMQDKNVVAFEDYNIVTEGAARKRKSKGQDYDKNLIYYDASQSPQKSRLSVKNQEKMQHLLAKLDILKTELTVTRDVMTSTLKAFGYSGFGDAYSRHDNKSAY